MKNGTKEDIAQQMLEAVLKVARKECPDVVPGAIDIESIDACVSIAEIHIEIARLEERKHILIGFGKVFKSELPTIEKRLADLKNKERTGNHSRPQKPNTHYKNA